MGQAGLWGCSLWFIFILIGWPASTLWIIASWKLCLRRPWTFWFVSWGT